MTNLTGLRIGGAIDNKAAASGITDYEDVTLLVLNTSGGTASVDRVGYLTYGAEGQEFKFAVGSTIPNAARACAVVVGGANNANIQVATRGRFNLLYTGTAPTKSQYLIFSGTSGAVVAQAFMSPDVIAVAMAGGAGGVVDAMLLTGSKFIDPPSANDVFRCDSAGVSDFVGTIATLPGGAVLTYNVTSGNENTLKPQSSSQLFKLILYNTTRSNSALISDVDTGTNTITLTANVPGDWQTTDSITPRGVVTGTIGSSRFYDIEIADTSIIPAEARYVFLYTVFTDSGGAGRFVTTHPYEAGAFSAAKLRSAIGPASGVSGVNTFPRAVINRKISILWDASGAATANPLLRLAGIEVAVP